MKYNAFVAGGFGAGIGSTISMGYGPLVAFTTGLLIAGVCLALAMVHYTAKVSWQRRNADNGI